ncbi:MAG: helix-turn-helix domain-containing protein [bacterium]|nr:helix-turn-helix domain-containing protein [bacterium]
MTTPRKPKRILTGEQKYDLWVRMLSGQLSQADAAAEVGVDRTTVTRLRAVARDGAIEALSASKPGKPKQSRAERTQIAELEAEATRLQSTIVEQAVELALLRGKTSWVRHEVARFECSRWIGGSDM